MTDRVKGWKKRLSAARAARVHAFRTEHRLTLGETAVRLGAMLDAPLSAEVRADLESLLLDCRALCAEAERRGDSTSIVPVPESYKQAMREKIESARRVSGRDAIRVRIVQGGSPGSGRGGKR